MAYIDFGFYFLDDREQYLIVKSLIFAKQHLSGVLASQSDFDSLLSKFPKFD